MAERKVWTAEELLALTPDERFHLMKEHLVTDLDQFPPEMLEAARTTIRDHIAKTESTQTAER
jgi:hypothetical protein